VRVAVIGLGASGLATARYLAHRGVEVVGFEQFTIGHDQGSSHGASRVVRFTYVDTLYTSLMDTAAPLWRDIEAERNVELLCRNGHVMLAPYGHDDVVSMQRALTTSGRTFELLDRTAMHTRFPSFLMTDEEIAVFQPDGGFVRPSLSVKTFADSAREAGAQLFEQHPIVTVDPLLQGIRLVDRNGDHYDVDRVVVSAGPWISRFVSAVTRPFVVSRQQFVYLGVSGPPSLYAPEVFPTWGHIDNWYGFPSDGQYPGLKIAQHTDGITSDPDAVDRQLDGDTLTASIAQFSHRVAGATGQLVSSATCLYTNTWNEDFVIDHLETDDRIVIMSPCSGHGFKFMPALGMIAGNLALGEPAGFDTRRFAIDSSATS
jgi:sarcosine oxidase